MALDGTSYDGIPRACERARSRAALAPDGELSMLELRSLRAHLTRCASCARVAADIEAITRAIRTAPLEEPPARSAFSARRRTSLLGRIPRYGVASQIASVAVGAIIAVTASSWASSDGIESAAPVRPIIIDETSLASVDAEPIEMRAYRHGLLLGEQATARPPVTHSGPQPL